MTSIVADPFRIEPGTVSAGVKRVRPYLAGQLVADSGSPLEIWEHQYYPQYAFAPDEVEVSLVEVGEGPRSKIFGRSVKYDVVADGITASAAATKYPDAPNAAMRDHTLFKWGTMTTWLEEDEVVHVHPRSPYVRIDALSSSRHVQVQYAGEIVADSRSAVVLFETGMPPRYYLPQTDIRLDLLAPTDTASHCPYKGSARYWTLQVGESSLPDVAWGYDTPLEESHRVAGLVCFWPEKSDDLLVTVDGARIGQ